jgi:hypothetical protein
MKFTKFRIMGLVLVHALVTALSFGTGISHAVATFSDTFAGGVSGTMTRNTYLKSNGDGKVKDALASDDGTTLTNTGALANTGNVAVNTNKFTVTASSGATAFAGDLAINTNKFNVTASSGATAFAGDLAINTNKFTVTASSGNTLVAGTLAVTGDVAVATNKFNVTASSGNTTVAGTLGVTGAINGPFGAVRDLTTPIVLTAAMSGQTRIAASTADAVTTYTLPAASVAGQRFCFAADTITGSNREIDVEPPAGSDLIIGTTNPAGGTGIASTAGAGHGIKNTHATAVRGNATCITSDGTNTWFMTSLIGTWAGY